MLIGVLLVLAGLVLGSALTLIGLYAWPGPAGRRRAAARGWHTIVVPLVDGILPKSALETAGRLSVAAGGRVEILAVLQVPRTMNINAENPPGLEGALSRLEAAESFVQGIGAEAHGEVVRVREPGDLVVHACEETGAGAVVIEPNPASRATADLLRALTEAKAALTFDIVVATSRDGMNRSNENR
jgi:hypothetical protein